MKRLPDQPSELIRFALRDLEQIEQDPRYEVDMGLWHAPQEEICHVCLAGAVMARSLDTSPTQNRSPYIFDTKTAEKLLALNRFRTGAIGIALTWLGHDLPAGVPDRLPVPDYSEDRDGFFSRLNEIADILEQKGL